MKKYCGYLTVGFLVSLIKLSISEKEVRIYQGQNIKLERIPMSIIEARKYVRWICSKHNDKPIVVCLDEFNTSSSDMPIARFNFLRNICRELGLVTILMGTNASAANMIDENSLGSPGSRNSEPAELWSYLVDSLDKPSLNSIRLRKHFYSSNEEVVEHEFEDNEPAMDYFNTLASRFSS